MSRLLAIDTSTSTAALAVVAGNTTLAEQSAPVRNGHGAELLPLIDAVLRHAQVAVRDLEAIAVAIGPGTFTGIRVGMAAAKGMALALGIPLVGVSSLAALAMRAVGPDACVAALLDARRGEVYAAGYEFRDGTPQVLVSECVVTPPLFAQQLVRLGRRVTCLGEGALRYADVFTAAGGNLYVSATPQQHVPSAVGLAQLALRRLARGKPDDVVTLAPNYLRASYAEAGG